MKATTKTVETPVLIVGAGPIGLSTALDLAWRGIGCTIIDQGDGSIDLPRGAMVAARTMEFCRRWGIADRVRATGFPSDWHLNMVYVTSLAGHLLERDDYPPQPLQRQPAESPEKRTWCPQLLFDPLLAKVVGEYDHANMRYLTRLDGFEQNADHVRAHVTDVRNGESYDIVAKYLVACDGSASIVRKAANIGLEGNPILGYSINIFFESKEMMTAHDKGQAERYLFVGPEGTWGNITVTDGFGQWRLTVIGSPEKMDLAAFDANAWVRRAMGRDDVPFRLIDVKPWRRSEQIAATYRSGRVILAGDAAHVMSPTGGFGMNTGVIDAINLGWKLEAMLNGWGGDGLLDSYEIEQKPVAKRNAHFSTHNYKLWVGVKQICGPILDDTPEGESARREVGRLLKDQLGDEWECLGVQLGYRYDGSPIVVPDGTPPLPDPIRTYEQSARPGYRAPHAWLPDGRSTLDLYGRSFVLLRLGANPPAVNGIVAAAKARGVPLEVVDIASPDIAALHGAKLVLVRPDGHSAWRADEAPKNAEWLIDVVRGALSSAGSDKRATATATA